MWWGGGGIPLVKEKANGPNEFTLLYKTIVFPLPQITCITMAILGFHLPSTVFLNSVVFIESVLMINVKC